MRGKRLIVGCLLAVVGNIPAYAGKTDTGPWL